MNDALLQKLLETVIVVFVPILASALVALAAKLFAYIKSRMSEQQIIFATGLAESLVLAAEQNGLTGVISDVAAEKKAWVLERLDAELRARGIILDLQILSDLIEGAVHGAFKL